MCDASISTAAKLLLANLGLYQYEGGTELFSAQSVYFNNKEDERLFSSGGTWNNSAYGLASFAGYDARSNASTRLGFRSAFVSLPSA